MSAPGKLVRSSRWKTGPVRGSARLVASVAWSLATCGQRPAGGSAERVKAGVGPSVDHQHRRFRGAGAEPVQGFLAVKTMKLPQPPLTAIEFNTALREARFSGVRARTHRRHERSVPRLRDHARLSRARARPPPNARRSASARPRSSGGPKKPSPSFYGVSHARNHDRRRICYSPLGPAGDAAKGRRADGPAPLRIISAHSFAAASPAPLSAVSNLAQIGRRESATIPDGES